MSEKHPEFKSERREQQRDRKRFQMRSNGRPEYLLLQVGGILRRRVVRQKVDHEPIDRHEKMEP